MRRRPFITLLATLFVLAVVGGSVFLRFQFFKSSPSHLTASPTQYVRVLGQFGLYDGCVPSSPSCVADLDRISAAGFGVVLNYGALEGSAASIRAYADRAAMDNLKLIWPLKDMAQMPAEQFGAAYKLLLADCHCSTQINAAQYVINLVKALPATREYYLADEPTDHDYQAIAAVGVLAGQLDSAHKRLVIVSGVNGTHFLSLYSNASFIDVVGVDDYPIGRTKNVQAGINDIGPLAQRLQREADMHHKQTVFALQAHDLARVSSDIVLCSQTQTCTIPTEAQMIQEKSLVAANARPALVLWYSYPYVVALPGQWQQLIAACKAII